MPSAELVWWGTLGAFLGGVAWVVSGLISLAIPGHGTEIPGTFSYYLLEVTFSIASIGMLGGLLGLHARQAQSLRRLGTAGFVVAFSGVALLLVSTVATIVVGREVLSWFFVLGMLGALIGLILLGVATLRAGVLPRWCGLLLIVGVIGFPIYFAMGENGGAIVLGFIWLGLGYALWSERTAPAEQPPRA